jgi:3-oxoacyl-[acyl-carrier-protein] synthase-3
MNRAARHEGMMQAAIAGVEYHLPETRVTNHHIEAAFPDWTAAKILDKTGIEERRHAAPTDCPTDLAVLAVNKLFASGACSPADIDFLLLCTQGADYPMPASACLLQDRLGLPIRAGALDFNLGCSGFVYGLGLAKGLIETRQAENVLLVTADTVSKFLHPNDRGNRTLLGDAAAATLVQARRDRPSRRPTWIGPFVHGTDGQGGEFLIVRGGGMRQRASGVPESSDPAHALYMHGPEVLSFALEAVPKALDELLRRAEMRADEVDLFVFHQANGFILEQLRDKLDIPRDKFVLAMSHCGNTASSSIPIALKDARDRGQLRPGMRVVLIGFGVGFSWSATVIQSM